MNTKTTNDIAARALYTLGIDIVRLLIEDTRFRVTSAVAHCIHKAHMAHMADIAELLTRKMSIIA